MHEIKGASRLTPFGFESFQMGPSRAPSECFNCLITSLRAVERRRTSAVWIRHDYVARQPAAELANRGHCRECTAG